MEKIYHFVLDTLHKAIRLSLTFLCLGVIVQLLIGGEIAKWDGFNEGDGPKLAAIMRALKCGIEIDMENDEISAPTIIATLKAADKAGTGGQRFTISVNGAPHKGQFDIMNGYKHFAYILL